MKEIGLVVVWLLAIILATVFCSFIASQRDYQNAGLMYGIAIALPFFGAFLATLMIVSPPPEKHQ